MPLRSYSSIQREWIFKLAAALLVLSVDARSVLAQSPSEMPIEPSRVVQLPLSGKSSQTGDVEVMQRTTNSGGGNSVNTITSTVTVPAPYNGSVATGTASRNEITPHP